MAPVFDVLRTCGLIVSLVFFVSANQNTASGPWIVSVEVETMSCVQNICKYLLNVRGGEFLGHSSWRLSPKEGSKGGSCEEWLPKFETVVIETLKWSTKIRASIPSTENKIYFCLRPYGGEWVHQGADVYLDPLGPVGLAAQRSTSNTREKQKNNLLEAETKWADLSHDTDVNQLPNIARPTRNEAKDIEILVNDKYVPLLELDSRNVQKHRNDNSINKFNNVRNDYNGNRNNINGRNNNNNNNDAINNYNLDERDVQESVNLLSNNENHNELQQNKHLIFNNKVARKKRYSNDTDDLFSVKDIFDAKVNLENSIKPKQPTEYYEDALIRIRKTRQTEPDVPKIDGLRVEHAEKEPEITEEFIPSVLAGTSVVLRLFGDGLTNTTVIAFTSEPQDFGSVCKYLLKGEFMVKKDSVQPRSAVFEVTAPDIPGKSKLFICTKNVKGEVSDPFKDDDKFIHQGVESYKIVAVHTKLLPLWISLALILTCLMFSALFSGLNLGLMSLDRTELKIISNTGTESERLYAKSIMPVRDHGNYLLCSILLGNVAVNSTFTIMLDSLTSGLFAVIFSTLLIVLFGEITPQAICCRHGLAIGAKTIFITKTVMMITAPLSYPVSKLLDYFLGEEIGNVYNRERLKELVKVTTDVNDLDKDEVNIISGALEMRKKTVSDVMTKLEDVFMLPITSVLDFETMSEIVKSGFSRIPVYEGDRGNIVTVLFIKDLAFVDPDDNTPLRTLCQYYQNPCNFVFEDVTLDVMFKQFKEGNKGHMAFVHRINNEGEGDPFYETIGLVTLEDVIEEMIQAEIVDETDVFMDNRTKRRRKGPQHKLQDFAAFAERHENQQCHISPQLTLATFQFLSTSVDAFRPDVVSETVLRRLLRQNVIYHIKLKGKARTDPSTYVFQQGKAVDYFVLILEGRVEVTVGRENLVFEAGPFTYFGVQALTQNVGVPESPTPSAKGSLQNLNMDSMLHHTFVPDYSVRAVTDVYYLIVKRSLYLAAKRATLMEKGALSKGATNEQFDTVVDKPPQSTTDSDQNITLSEALMKSTHRPFTTSSCFDEQDAGTSRAAAKNVDIVDPKRSAPLITIRDINDDDDILSIYESSLSINPKNLKARTSTYIDPDLIVPPETDVRNTKYEPKDRRTSLGESKSATGRRVLIKGSKLDQERERIEKRSALFEERKYKSKDSKDASKTQREYFIKRVVSTINLPKFSSDTVVEESGVERSEDILAAKDYDETKDMGELIKSKSASEMKKSIIKRDYIPIEQRKSISIRDDVSLIEHSMSDENASKKSERSKLNSLLNFLKRSSSKIDDQNQTQPTTTTTNTQPTTEKDSKQSLIDEHWPSEIDRSDERAKTKDDVTGSDENMKASRDAMKKSSDSKRITDDKSVSEKDKSLDSECVLKSDDLTITRSSNDEGDSTATRTGESSSKWSTSKSSISQVSRTQEDEISRQRFRNANITEKDNGEIRDVKLTERTAPNLKFLEDEKENADRKPTSVRERGKNKKPDTLSHESLVREDDDNRRLEVNEEILRKLTKILNILEKKDHT